MNIQANSTKSIDEAQSYDTGDDGMPSLTAYTPFETLRFCQSLAQHGTDASAFEQIAASLNASEIIRESETYDEQRLSASELHSLYDDLLARERDGSPAINGDVPGETVNPRKRKLSASSGNVNGEDSSLDEDLVLSLIDKLYAQFREEAIKDIRNEEDAIAALQNEIGELQKEVDNSPLPVTESTSAPPASVDVPSEGHPPPPPQHKRQPSRTDVSALLSPQDETPAYSRQGQEERMQDQTTSRPSSNGDTRPQPPGITHPPSLPSQKSPVASPPRPSAEPAQLPSQPPNLSHSPGAFHRTLPPPSPQRPSFGPAPAAHGFIPGPQGHPVPLLPPPAGMSPHMPPPIEYANQKRSSSTSTPARGSPIPPPQQPYPAYPPYQQPPPPQWPHPYPPPQHPYSPHMQYPNQPYYMPSPGGRPPYQTPVQSPYPQYQPTPPGHYPGPPPQGWHPAPQYPPYHQSMSATTTPSAHAVHRRSAIRSAGSSTPWKRTPLRPGQSRPTSPNRPDRAVSPLTDTEDTNAKQERRSSRIRQTPTEDISSNRSTRRGRPPSATPSGAPESRSQSIASHKSETPSAHPSGRRMQNVKAEAPSTPMSTSDLDQSRPTRSGRPRNLTAASTPRPAVDMSHHTAINKRKRSPETLPGSSVTPPLPSFSSQLSPDTVKGTIVPRKHSIYAHDPSLVLVTKTFAKTSQLVLNEITSHKLAGIFAKPLSERDAPGYKDLIFRPADLKAIRAAVSKGSKAAVAAIESLESERCDTEGNATPTKHSSSSAAKKEKEKAQSLGGKGEGSVGNGIFLVKKTEELVPPKGIVNSAQLEMELTRMFANAVMFNPLPSDQRGFGRGLKIRKNGGDLHVKAEIDIPTGKGDGDGEGDEGDEQSTSASEEESEASSTSDSSEGGGIISDTREMFTDVVAIVGRWREVEAERITSSASTSAVAGGAGLQAQGLGVDQMGRQGSVSMMSVSSAVQHEEEDVATPATGDVDSTGPGLGTSRKRRRIGGD